MSELRTYQQEGVDFLAGRRGALLADEPGLGKTIQAIRAADAASARRVLVICPASVVDNWHREINRWRAGGWAHCVMSYDRARRGNALPFGGKLPDTVVLDEAHYLKSKTAQRTKAILGEGCKGDGLIAGAERVWLLTGTPMPNNPTELWPLLRAVMPEALLHNGKTLDLWGFTKRYCVTRNNGFGIEIVRAKNLDDLAGRMQPFFLRRKKDQVAKDIPPITFDTLPVRSTDALREIAALERGDEGKKIRDALASDDPKALKKLAPHVAKLRRLVGLAKVGPVVAWCKDWFDSGGGKLVLFAYHRDVIDQIGSGLIKTAPVVSITGDTPQRTRQQAVDLFQENPAHTVFLGQITAAGTGITLTASSNVLFVESSWVPADNEQAAMRVHRIGQRDPVTVRIAALAGSLDEQIQRVVERKMQDIKGLFG